MSKIEQDLKALFENNFDCYAIFESGNMVGREMAMTKGKFMGVVGGLLTEYECNFYDK